MSAPDRQSKLDRDHPLLSVRRHRAMLGIARSGVYRLPRPANDDVLALLRTIDELFTRWPFLDSRRMTAMLRAEGEVIYRKRAPQDRRRVATPLPTTAAPTFFSAICIAVIVTFWLGWRGLRLASKYVVRAQSGQLGRTNARR